MFVHILALCVGAGVTSVSLIGGTKKSLANFGRVRIRSRGRNDRAATAVHSDLDPLMHRQKEAKNEPMYNNNSLPIPSYSKLLPF